MVTSNTTLDSSYYTVMIDNNNVNINRIDITLPDASHNTNKIYIIKLHGISSNLKGVRILTTSSQNIYFTETSSWDSYSTDTAGNSVMLQAYGSAWYVLFYSGSWTGA